MPPFRFSTPIQVRYSDLDVQWHVNNARFLSFLEQARFEYLIQLGLFDGQSFHEIGMILADMHIAYLNPIDPGQKIEVALRVSRLGNKSIHFAYEIRDAESGQVKARAESVNVAYNYHTRTSQPVPALWRDRISQFEEISSEI